MTGKAEGRTFDHRAAHCFIYTKTEQFSGTLMILRADGHLGFAGGQIDPHESILQGLQRELLEELGLVPNADHHFELYHKPSLWSGNKPGSCTWQFSFYKLHIGETEFRELEANVSKAKDYGTETLGLLRVPLDAKPLTIYLTHTFVGGCSKQLLGCMKEVALLPGFELDT